MMKAIVNLISTELILSVCALCIAAQATEFSYQGKLINGGVAAEVLMT